MRRVLIIVDSFLAVLFGLCLIGLTIVVFIEGRDDLDILVFLVVIGVPYGLLRFVLLEPHSFYIPSQEARLLKSLAVKIIR